MLAQYLRKRQGHGISDEDHEVYVMGFKDACEAMQSDEVYYDVLVGKPGLFDTIQKVATYVENAETSPQDRHALD